MHLLVLTASGLLVGGLLGALGAGGSVLTVPILVYVLGEDVSTAATTSLLVVGLAAASGAASHWRAGTVRLPTALALSGVASAGSIAGSLLRERLGGRGFLIAFAGLLLLAAALVWRPADRARGEPRECVLRPDVRSCAKLGAAGMGVGFLTGLFGVGGGFVIVTVLLLVLSFPPRQAVGTSLVVVALASAMALAASARGAPADWEVAIPFALAGVAGSGAGRRLAARLDEALLRRAFALVLVILSAFLFARNLPG
ncbi:sulfite exporter TauE/SafE family protein [Anaeromyxobacter sp. Fw109-5]|uniref:sulfite exporter TauE/SafE family protein n=1 Tax=Anaeromyxobacter sp. (strain Fw109-5) TaxID=404589 RepID=UPI000158A464|nr:sulfite exporter TauE/SafE family protein [Anaeromyxobacter sp. Fw109-5]ABS24977.1 protein of unknown function DUF81 [Anaeromyxobacter sp. Fw109-5]